jgi:putative two-component system response regulator
MRVLTVEDDAAALDLLEHALARFGHEVTRATSGEVALARLRREPYPVVISDWQMPGMSGLELCRQVRRRMASNYTYLILLTSRSGASDLVRALDAGADEFLTKPFNPHELYVRLRVAERILALESRDVLIFSLAKLAEARDTETGAHLERIRAYCVTLASRLADTEAFGDQIDHDFIALLHQTSPLHDIGKVGIPDSILLKPGRLTAEEFEVMKQHTTIGGQTLEAAARAYPQARYLEFARDIALAHHEKYDGSGYPFGLSGENIPLAARVTALADVYDALTSPRVYKAAYSHEVACDIIREGRGKHFDPRMADLFLERQDEFLAIKEQLGEPPEEECGARNAECGAC